MSGNPSTRRKMRRRKRQLAYDPANPPAAVSVYTGPHRLSGETLQLRTTSASLNAYVTSEFTTSVAGLLASVVNNDPSGYGDWADYAAIWDEYRVLEMTLKYVPNNKYTKATTICLPVLTVIDRDSSGALASYGAAANFGSCEIRSLEDVFSMDCPMSGAPDDAFITTAATASTWYFKYFATGLSNSTTYGGALVRLIVQFRGKN